jgi:uncharacterized protein (UPF0264 family)
LRRQRGSKTVDVKAINTGVLEAVIPAVVKRLTKVSPKIMLYAKIAAVVFKVTATAGIQLLDFPTVALQASR